MASITKVLALDIATKTGWATNTSSGVWDFKVKRGESTGMRIVRFKAKLKEMLNLEPDINLIAYELPAGRFKASIMVASEMIGVLKDLCEEKNINYAHYSAKEIKKHATGKGNCGKPLMVSTAKDKFKNIEIIDDNHADALWLLDLVNNELEL